MSNGKLSSLMLILVFVLWAAVIFVATAFNKNDRKEKSNVKYDERQIYEQGQAYRWAFWSLMIYLVFIMLFEVGFETELLNSYNKTILGISIGTTTYAVYCIFKDAYFEIGEGKTIVLLTNLSAIALLIQGVSGVANKNPMQSSTLILAASFIIIDISIFAHRRIERKRERDGE